LGLDATLGVMLDSTLDFAVDSGEIGGVFGGIGAAPEVPFDAMPDSEPGFELDSNGMGGMTSDLDATLEVPLADRPDSALGFELDSTGTCAACGSHAGHSFNWGGISRPHSGQIQWNIDPIYACFVVSPFSYTPYPTHLGTLSGIGIRSQGSLSMREESRQHVRPAWPPGPRLAYSRASKTKFKRRLDRLAGRSENPPLTITFFSLASPGLRPPTRPSFCARTAGVQTNVDAE
jgi:hypothetical protein